ncbi:MAG: Xaa-Pro aminopeptidase [Myxococcaceae bacterium]|nr:Xaa-Pro aminopeptidase [Myxococcaceae bacterium]
MVRPAMSFSARRSALMKSLDRPLLLFSGGFISRNYPANSYPFRADSTFLYLFESPEPNSAALLDPAEGTVTLFLPERTIDDALWHGAQPSFADERARHGVSAVLPIEELEKQLEGRSIDSLAIADRRTNARMRALTNTPLDFDDPNQVATRPAVLDAIAKLRLIKDADEIAQMRRTAAVTKEAHESAMRASVAGVKEEFLAGLVEGAFARHGCVPAYGTILSVRGEVLHNHAHTHTLHNGDIVLLDAGAENASGYCSDVTRSWPVGDGFTPEGRDVYDIVLKAQEASIAMVRPGVRYREVHRKSSLVIAEGLVAMGLMRGAPEALVESGAHALFFPHGVGHQLGLDVHDLEAFGDRIHYPNGRTRSTQFGTQYLRMDMDLVEGMTFTIEPGIYFVPAILHSPKFREQFKGQVDFERAENFLTLNSGRGFGGIRIEDDVMCTGIGAEVLTALIPKKRDAVEALAGAA